MSIFKRGLAWVALTLSTDGSSSSSRVLQAVIVLNMTAILWIVIATAKWTISDNVRLIVLTLITAGAGSYMVNKIGGKDAA